MKVFREMYIDVNKAGTPGFIQQVEGCLSNGWSRNREAEEALINGPDTFYIFACAETTERRAAHVALVRENEDRLYVANVVPPEPGEISMDQYNYILSEFYRSFVEPAATHMGIRAELTSDDKSLRDWIPDDAALLESFSRIANKSTGSSHPFDRGRWFDFLVSVHTHKKHFDSEYLRRWLIEVERWPEDKVDDLVQQYDFAMDLLRYLDEHPA